MGEKCPNCGKHFVKRHGRYGEFVCCVDYPTCKTVKKEILAVPCPKCGGDLSPRKTRFGKVFYGCTNYPKCDFTAWDKPVPRHLPRLQEPLAWSRRPASPGARTPSRSSSAPSAGMKSRWAEAFWRTPPRPSAIQPKMNPSRGRHAHHLDVLRHHHPHVPAG